ncbi:superfamily II DNA/RNA helicase [Sphaerotilus hippei]|uniref:Superfamily II DNA/RNA helicase n=1 Tax=Sphaerotilus hippei TaxID=744406 RepID=A0A318HAZ1_9BURK|nr:DEAD/DEAH box helicase [Sphaerotilus hippei]PXW99442.1 superfamily II DNA/RNA helicase [Sphaerotilus hippei]
MTFASLGLTPALCRAVRELGFSAPTPIQAAAIPAALRGDDVQGAARTGSGKTVAFALPLLQGLKDIRFEWPRRPQALVLVPTRELAVQVGEVLRDLAGAMPEPPRVAVLFGGVSINPQMMGLRGGTEIVVATPGRLLDLVEHNALRLDSIRTLVLDEADRLLDLGFADELARVLALLPERRQNLFFSATFSEAVQALAAGLLRDPVRIEPPAGGEDTPAITQRAIEVDAARRTMLLRHLLADPAWDQVLVFVATRYATELVAEKLGRAGLAAGSLHGELSQGARTEVLKAFKQRRVQVLVATDVAARGIDIAALPVVVNYDLPRSTDDYTHRIGRTGRAGSPGLAVSFISASTEAHFRLIEKRQHQRVPRERIPGFEPVETATPEQAVGGVKGTRMSKKDKLRAAAAEVLPPPHPVRRS